MSHVVIGSGWGDEGKGLITDYLVAKQKAAFVARFNGGGQAGHTVVTPDGKRHVFSHVGAGHYAGAQTVLGKRFIINPLILEREVGKLMPDDLPKIVSHGIAQVSTIFDMLLNASAEVIRGDARHGSCGLGINETVTRALSNIQLSASDLKTTSVSNLADTLECIARIWVPRRADELGVGDVLSNPDTALGKIMTDANWLAHAEAMQRGMAYISVIPDFEDPVFTQLGIVFEGAQGLAIDELMGEFPYVTRSLTGLPYAIETAAEMGIDELDPVYVTRAYSTRHGAGPLPYEGVTFSEVNVTDTTNATNEWQGTIRFAPLNVIALANRVKADMERSKVLAHMVDVRVNEPTIAVTCIDQVGPKVRVIAYEREVTMQAVDLPQFIENVTGIKVSLVSYGPTREDVHPKRG
jgi:adenylosuccinate synthase